MNYPKQVNIKAKTEIDAALIAKAMGDMSGNFSAKEWQAISKKLNNKVVQTRIRLLIS